MFFFFFGGNGFNWMPPRLRRFINGTFFGFLVTLYLAVQFRSESLLALGLVLPLLVGLYFAVRKPQPRLQRQRTKPFEGRFDRDYDYPGQARAAVTQPFGAEAADAADRALRLAGFDPETVRVRLEDIGLIVYAGASDPVGVARLDPVPGSASHIRPFIRLISPLGHTTGQQITFELTDESGTVAYRTTEDRTIEPGLNLISPRTWLPLDKVHPVGHWILQVSLGATRLGLHPFRWAPGRAGPRDSRAATAARQFSYPADKLVLRSDGEIGAVRAATERLQSEPLSLEELLADQQRAEKPSTRNAKGSGGAG